MNYEETNTSIKDSNEFMKYIQKYALVGNFAAQVIKIGKKKIFTTCDGVGTKMLVAKYLNKYDTIGIDLVAMSANDLLTAGAIPVSFMDYIACGKITDKLKDIIDGIARGCKLAGCKLSGGETAIMPDAYRENDIDLAGFAVGIAEKNFPRKDLINKGDVIIGLPSSGIHSNGLSLAREVLDKEHWPDLLTPTKIYTNEMKSLLKKKCVYAAAHITGGGLKNILRVIPSKMNYELYYNWLVPSIFYEISESTKITIEEMSDIYNLGIGMALIIDKKKAASLHYPIIGKII